MGAETPEWGVVIFCMPGNARDVITYANFGEDRFRVLAWRWVEIWALPSICFVAITTVARTI